MIFESHLTLLSYNMKTYIAVIIAFGLLFLLGISIPIGYYGFLGKLNNETNDEKGRVTIYLFPDLPSYD